MRRKLLILGYVVFAFLLIFNQSWGQCPEDTIDSGICDTLYVEVFPEDQYPVEFPHLARFPIYITHDVPDADIDSLSAIVIPLCYTHTNSATYCSLNQFWNAVYFPGPFPPEHSIFRDLVISPGDTIFNWMFAIEKIGSPWSNIIFDLGDQVSHFWLLCIATTQPKFWEGSRVLWATMTFKMGDTTTICIDSCFWPITNRFSFTRSDAKVYVPRHLMPVCEYIVFPGGPPFFTEYPFDQSHSCNGEDFASSSFSVGTTYPGGEVISVMVDFTGSGVENENVVFTIPPPAGNVEGYVTYDVTDHCQAGGTMELVAETPYGVTGTCSFDIELFSNPPIITLPEIWFALADHPLFLWVPAIDPDYDAVMMMGYEAFWYEADSLRAPTNPPACAPGHPALFAWAPTEADTGTWICLFSATDACGSVGTHQISILIGKPFCGDCAEDVKIDVDDVVYLIDWLYKGGTGPDPFCKGDANCDGDVDVGDVVYLINYLFKYGSAPCFDCCGKKL